MSLNFLLGFTGVLSFGHAAYFGLGAYGAGLTMKYVVDSTPLALAWPASCSAAVAAAMHRPADRAARGVYFAMVTIAFGQVFYYIAFQWSSTDRRRRRPCAASPASRSISAVPARHPQRQQRSTYSCCSVFALASASWRSFCARRSAARCWRSARTSAAPASSASRWTGTSGSPSRCPASSWRWPARSMRCSTTFADPRALHYSQSGDFVIMAVMGGMRSFWGPLLGAAMFVVLQDYISSHHRELDVLRGLIFVLVVLFFPRGVLGILQRRKAWRHEPFEGPKRLQAFRQPGRRQRCLADVEPGRIARHHRSQRRRQDHLLQPDQRLFPADLRPHHLSTATISPRWRRHERVTRGMAAPSRSPKIFPELAVRENLRIAVEVAGG
jgi:branched-chain amino acid transport system permease protein